MAFKQKDQHTQLPIYIYFSYFSKFHSTKKIWWMKMHRYQYWEHHQSESPRIINSRCSQYNIKVLWKLSWTFCACKRKLQPKHTQEKNVLMGGKYLHDLFFKKKRKTVRKNSSVKERLRMSTYFWLCPKPSSVLWFIWLYDLHHKWSFVINVYIVISSEFS